MGENVAIGFIDSSYGLKPVGTIRIIENDFIVEIIDPQIVDQTRCIYAFLVGDEVVRAGSTQKQLRIRMREWQRDVSKALKGLKSATPQKEAIIWREILPKGARGKIYARMGLCTQTAFGQLNIFHVEEAALIAKFQPRLCWDRARFKNAE